MTTANRTDWIELVTAATAEPVSLTEAKDHCRVSYDEEDGIIQRLIYDAMDYCQKRDSGRRQYINTAYDWKLSSFPSYRLILPRAPLQSVTSITYYDSIDTSTVLSSSLYHVATPDDGKGWVQPISGESWPSTYERPNAVTIRFVAGYGSTAASVPSTIKRAMLLLIGHWYENRESSLIGTISKEVEFGVHSLLAANETGSYA
jgi:uncharacterized phiE125 gp8 family phage protein